MYIGLVLLSFPPPFSTVYNSLFQTSSGREGKKAQDTTLENGKILPDKKIMEDGALRISLGFLNHWLLNPARGYYLEKDCGIQY
jgi:hypothetical protein